MWSSLIKTSVYYKIFLLFFFLAKAEADAINLSSYDLTEPSGIYENLTVQDQDGLGTCYANASSTILYGILPNNPEVSYFDLALKYKKQESRYNNASNYLDSGHICKTISAAKKFGGVCQREDALFEKFVIHGDSEGHSGKFFGHLDKIYDSMNRFTPEQNKDFVQVLEKTYQDFLQEGRKFCIGTNAPERGLSIYSGLSHVAFRVEKKLKRLKKKKEKSPEDVRNISALKKVRKNLKNKLEIRIAPQNSNFPISIVRDRHEVSKTKLVQQVIENVYKDGLKKIDPEDYDQISLLEENMFREFGLEGFPELYKSAISRHTYLRDKESVDPDFCIKQQALKSMSSYHEVLNKNKDFFDQCEMHYPLSSVVKLLESYVGDLPIAPNMELILSSLLNIKSKNDLIKELLGVDCVGKAITIPRSVTCREYHPGKDYEGALPSKEKINKKMRLQINKSLSEGRPVGLGVCSLFFYQKGVDTKYGDSDLCTAGGKNRYHAITILGFKERKNGLGRVSREYLIQNSWGEDCGYKVDSRKCIGKTGRFWLDEDELFPNVRTLSEVKI